MPAPVTFDTALRLCCEAEPGAALVLTLLPARTHHQQLVAERLQVRGASAHSVFTEAASATRRLHLTARGGPIEVELEASVRLLQAEVADTCLHRDATAAPLAEPESLRHLVPSRWCPSDRLSALAASEFMQVAPPFERATAIDRWVRRHVRVLAATGGGVPAPDAIEALESGAGTPSALAHLMIALCRAARLPARYATTVPLGDAADGGLHPWVEVLVGDAWLAFDPSCRLPRTALLRWGTGRDAADVPMVLVHGEATPPRLTASVRADATPPALRRRDRAAGAISAATLGSLAEATRWHQDARLAARRPGSGAGAASARLAPSRVAAAAARAASSVPRAVARTSVFSATTGSCPSGAEPPGSRSEPLRESPELGHVPRPRRVELTARPALRPPVRGRPHAGVQGGHSRTKKRPA